MTAREFFEKIRKLGGNAYLVGGAVRDSLMGIEPHDRDYVVCGISLEEFVAAFPDAQPVGNAFPVFLLDIHGEMCEIAFARKEKKSGAGYKGFNFTCSKDISIEDDLFRRDTSINSMAQDETGRLIDPYGGADDISEKKVRAVSEHFSEDPIRALRAARQAAQFGFEIDPKTLEMMRKCGPELKAEPRERKFAELEKALACARPSEYFRNLMKAGLLEQEFPWLFKLIGKTQPEKYHPEGDSFEHTMEAVDRAAKYSARPDVRFAALAHDIGKGETPEEMLPHHYGHENLGGKLLPAVDKALGLPRKWRLSAAFAIKEHMRAPRLTNPVKIRDMLRSAQKSALGADGFRTIVRADKNGSLPPYLEDDKKYISAMGAAAKTPIPPDLDGPQIAEFLRSREIEAVKRVIAEEKAEASSALTEKD